MSLIMAAVRWIDKDLRWLEGGGKQMVRAVTDQNFAD